MSDDALDSPGQRLRFARKEAGYDTAKAFAQKAGTGEVTYRAYENDQIGFANFAPRYARLLGVTTDWLLEGGDFEGGTSNARPPEPEPRDEETVDIMKLDLRFSMGPGSTIDDYIEETPVKFGIDYVRSFTRTPFERLRLAHGVGDSMFPTLQNSDLVWIDTTQRMLNLQDRIWAISLFGAAGIKRLRAVGNGKILVISDNKEIADQEVDADDLIIGGRVIRLNRDC